MDYEEIVKRISLLNSHLDELWELVYDLESFPIMRAKVLLQVVESSKRVETLEKTLKT